MNNWWMWIICKIPGLRKQCDLWYNSNIEEINKLDKSLDKLEAHIMRIQYEKKIRRTRRNGPSKYNN